MLTILLLNSFTLSVLAHPGEVDESFGTTGFYFDDSWNKIGNIDQSWFTDAAILADGSVISVGARIDNDGQNDRRTMYVQKVLPSGFRDPSFGGGTGTFRLLLFASGSDSVARAVRVRPDGKIVIAGVCNIFDSAPGTPNRKQSGYGMCALRLMPSGDLDPSFGGNTVQVQHTPSDPNSYFNYTMPLGTTFLHYPGQVESGYAGAGITVNAAAMDLALHADGRVTLAGYSVTRDFNGNTFLGYNRFATLATLTPSGILDSAVKIPGDQVFESARRSNRAFRGVEAKSDGGVIAVGYNPIVNQSTGGTDGSKWIVYDSSTQNTYYSDAGAINSKPLGIKLTRSNKFLVSGAFTPSGSSFIGTLMMRFNSDLTVDITFGTGGRRYYWHNGISDLSNLVGIFSTLKITEVQPDGRILGYTTTGVSESPLDPGPGNEQVVRFNPNGSVDHSLGDSFGGSPSDYYSYGCQNLYRYVGGNVVQRINLAGFARTQWDGKILAGGNYVPSDAGRAGITRRQSTFRQPNFNDLDNDGRADLAVYRPSDSNWFHVNSFSSTFTSTQFGLAGDKIAPADYDGDGKTDRAIFRSGVWWILRSSDSEVSSVQWGLPGDLPRPGDFNGDGFADYAVFRPSNGTWYILYSNPIQPGNVFVSETRFGLPGDVPLIADFDGDGKSDIAVFRQGAWYFVRSSDGSMDVVNWGLNGDVPVAGDYDGDSRTDLAVYRNGVWWIVSLRTGQITSVNWGLSGDVPAQNDYDNDGKCDFAVYRNGTWWILRATGIISSHSFGLQNDIPLSAAYNGS